MVMNGAPVVMNGTACESTNSNATYPVTFFNVPVQGGPPIRHVRVEGHEPMPTTFLRFLGWMVPGDFSKIDVAAAAEAAPERPVDLMLVLDRSGSMGTTGGTDAAGNFKITALKIAVNAFLGLSNTFSVNDQIGMVSFSSRGCGDASGTDSTINGPCTPDIALDFASSSHISTIQTRVSTFNALGGTNTMEAIRTARGPLAQVFADPNRATTRKAVLLVTDGQPTFMKRDSDSECKRNPKTGNLLPSPGNGDTGGGPFTNGCKQGVPTTPSNMLRQALTSSSGFTSIGNQYLDVIRCTRSITGCVTNGAMYEANLTRNCGFNNSACGAGGDHDVVFFAIAIGKEVASEPQASMDKNAKCLLARMANAEEIRNVASGVVETLNGVCTGQITTSDNDPHTDLNEAWPACATGAPPCIDPTQEKGIVFMIDVNGNVTTQLTQVFNEIASLLKLRLVL